MASNQPRDGGPVQERDEQDGDQIMRDGEVLPEPADVATASTNDAIGAVSAPHSPLPWNVGGPNESDPTHIVGIESEDGWTIADLYGYTEDDIPELSHNNAHANAEFIIRACNNHQALIDALKALVEDCDWYSDDTYSREPPHQLGGYARAKAAIAKAEGREVQR